MPWRATPTSFVGRRQEVADVRRMLQRRRLVSVTGIAGVGKTRVAIRAAQLMRRAFTDGVEFVDLSGHTDPASLEQVIAQALDVTGDLTAQLSRRRQLLVLDTCEHLADACSGLVRSLLRAAPGLHVLATSRQALRVPGGQALIVRPLAVPGGESALADVARVESVSLLLDRIAAVDPGFELTERNAAAVAEVCRRLEGIPLAIELVAARARHLPVDELLTLMDAYGPLGSQRGHSTMRAVIAWSHELCSPEERLLWERLTVFAGTFERAAAEAVCSGGALPAARVYPTLAALVEKSIVTEERDERRTAYGMPDSVREFAADRLEGTGEQERLRTRHREHYYAVAEAFGAEWPGGRADWANLRAALESFAADPATRERGLRMGLRLGRLWAFGGPARYGRRYLARLLPITSCPDSVRLRALLQVAQLAAGGGDLTAARGALDEAEAPAARVGARGGCHLAKTRGTVSLCEGDLAAAERHLTESIKGLSPDGVVDATVELGVTLMLAARTGEADEVLTRARALCGESGDAATAAWTELALALARRAAGRYAEADTLATAALRTQVALHITFGRALCVEVLGRLAADQGRPARAVRLLSAVQRLWGYEVNPLLGAPILAAERDPDQRELRETLGRQYGKAVAAGRAMSAEEAIAEALSAGGAPPVAVVPFWAPLTPREADVAELVADGLTNRLIAQRLLVARRTVDSHMENIFAKLGFSGRGQVAAWVMGRRQRENG
ncbi:LuxR C-terminal-related transcriptional regulator [Nonomuraea sp. NPDC049141]|uniref:ATP-binding protein n=1 Tax=Nonomuraea sp. NPDC049141 TaxID=3155500 RepID=UPI0033F508FD